MNSVYKGTNPYYYTVVRGTRFYVDNINNRIKIIDRHNLSESIIDEIIDFANNINIGKLICFCEKEHMVVFEKCGFKAEGTIKGFFKGIDAVCLSYFTNVQRKESKLKELEELILSESLLVSGKHTHKTEFKYCIRNACEKDIPQMISIFKEVFESYPSPVTDKKYLRKAMMDRVMFKVALEGEKIIGIASADMDLNNLNAEITDCATYTQYRGRGILPNLIISLEKDLKERGFISLFSLSRAANKGINKTLSKLGYEYNGRLINNCHICGDFEDMNIWTKLIND